MVPLLPSSDESSPLTIRLILEPTQLRSLLKCFKVTSAISYATWHPYTWLSGILHAYML